MADGDDGRWPLIKESKLNCICATVQRGAGSSGSRERPIRALQKSIKIAL